MTNQGFPALLASFLDGPAWDIVEHHDLDLEYLDDWDHDWQSYWGLNDAAAALLHAFAQDGTGGMVCLWTYDDQPLDEAPVVHLGSEGDSCLLAADLAQFLALTALGLEPFALAEDRWEGWSEQEVHEGGVAFLEDHDVALPTSVEDAVTAARTQHPDVTDWVSERLTV